MASVDIERLMMIYGPPLATAAVSWGALPPTPKRVRAIQQRFGTPVQYLMLFNLIAQGRAGFNYQVAGIVTAIFFFLNKFLDT
jgi:hypothetical protein